MSILVWYNNGQFMRNREKNRAGTKGRGLKERKEKKKKGKWEAKKGYKEDT